MTPDNLTPLELTAVDVARIRLRRGDTLGALKILENAAQATVTPRPADPPPRHLRAVPSPA